MRFAHFSWVLFIVRSLANSIDIVVVGSGPSGVQAAQTLVEAGLQVLMLDAGNFDSKYDDITPQGNFLDLRAHDETQHRYLLGDDFESISDGDTKVGAQLTPSRKYVLNDVKEWLKTSSTNFTAMETLAKGGLGGAWGAGCCVYSPSEIEALGLSKDALNHSYQTVLNRIGVSKPGNDIAPYTMYETLNDFDILSPDQNHTPLLKQYQKKKAQFNRRGIFLGEPALAILTRDLNGRKKKSFSEMGFYTDRDKSVYRSWITVEELMQKSNFEYKSGYILRSFKNIGEEVSLEIQNLGTKRIEEFNCPKLVMCCGPLGTARVLLRSNKENASLPLLCNPYSYLTCIQPRMLGKEPDKERTSFAQLSMFLDVDMNNFGASMASLYSYRSLMLFRTLSETPLNTRDARIIMQYLTPAITIAGIHHPDKGHSQRCVSLEPDQEAASGDRLRIDFEFTKAEEEDFKQRDRQIGSALRKLGCYPIKKLSPGSGASIHYAGTVPYSDEDLLMTQTAKGQLRGFKNVYIGDGSGFNYLPAKGLTFTLMANADRVARNLI